MADKKEVKISHIKSPGLNVRSPQEDAVVSSWQNFHSSALDIDNIREEITHLSFVGCIEKVVRADPSFTFVLAVQPNSINPTYSATGSNHPDSL
ncbi:hypothetical protein HBH56_205110 [Parastagonospora nodorum]|uniref:Uncharacterized protein n=2 Tax=Phaeosphaeria nodorum (strain SN15 / ATCC MYA-4574 / FGSC 10173) TaxID=321614 RepID=A0A7U2EXD8_PHANO|nr:hypothetical protein SNOG_14946 [Parastagonospora nodorum SN15]KAH3906205.1 hypothetical protein HBH56_205110 [Parastagonospora nodorum]EAT77798.1 hypothetical protein SNOG_14946 [Parastagonospora nodorum SN15]KAH3923829.1 hypothetical protein HBH54_203980 [Parastagonospora nodorum]KAH3962246.1 hypothetical protein HBH51_175280 [Parastagonospora nodorum]KAH4079560.1 hypothetical protein HBH46_233160 [Parastagonospora nodorum]